MHDQTDAPPEPQKAKRVRLKPRQTVEQCFIAIASACLDHLEANLPAVLAGHEPEGIHQMRVALRRLRSAIHIFHAVLPLDAIEHRIDEMKALAATLGTARDLDVFREEIVGPVAAHYPGSKPLEDLMSVIAGRRTVAWANALAAVRTARTSELISELRGDLAAKPWREAGKPGAHKEPIVKFARKMLNQRLKKVVKHGKHMETMSVAERHQMRIALKKLRYGAEFFSSLYPADGTKPYIKTLGRLQDVFGFLNDLATAERLLAELNGQGFQPKSQSLAEGLVLGWHGHAAEAAWPDAKKRWAALEKLTPFWARQG